jgi:Ca2+-transporting ATPase
MAFTCLTLAQFFNVFNSRSDRRSAFADIFSNHWVWGALGLSIVLQVIVTYVPAMQQAFGTMPLSLTDWAKCIIPASAVLWMRELWKLLRRRTTPSRANA